MAVLCYLTQSYCCTIRTVSRSPLLKSLFRRQSWRALRQSCVNLNNNLILPHTQPNIMKIETEHFETVLTPEVKKLASMFSKYGYEIRIAGGAVRDLLMNKVPKDLDFASTATPDEMKEIFTKENVRMINMKGETHGTVTARIDDKENFEITTLRIDKNQDGRHCEVEFTTDWLLDASRRDLTINSMFLGLDRTVYDYFNGYEDLKKRRVVFVNDAEQRIQEDYLRILRYFRFYGRIAKSPDAHDLNTLQAIEKNAKGLSQISGERIWSELSKTLEGNHGRQILRLMIKLGLSPYIGLPEKPNLRQYEELCDRCDRPLAAISLLVGLLDTEEDMLNLNKRLKMSAYNRDLGLFLVKHRDGICDEEPVVKFIGDLPNKNPLLPYQKLLLFTKFKISDVKSWILQTLRYRGEVTLEDEMAHWQMPRFPINGLALRDRGVTGKQITYVMNGLKEYWANFGYTASTDVLMSLVPTLQRQYDAELRRRE